MSLHSKARYWFSKWPIANLIDRSKRVCWAGLVDWALHERGDDPDENEYQRLRNKLSGGAWCAKESTEHRDLSCYCGKFVNGELRRKVQP